MIYRVYSDHIPDYRTQAAVQSWYRDGITNIPVKDCELKRKHNNIPYLKDILDKGVERCENNDDVIIYSNTDIFLVNDKVNFPCEQFFCVRKNVPSVKYFSENDIKDIPYEYSVNCDTIGFTKKWYLKNRKKIPDFLIGRPNWDLTMLRLLKGKRLFNKTYHVEHKSEWKTLGNNEPTITHNVLLHNKFLKKKDISYTSKGNFDKASFFHDMKKYGFDYLSKPVFITFYTESHEQLYNDIFLPSFKKTFNDSYILIANKGDEQLCTSATYHQQGWRKTQINKLQSVLQTVTKMPEGNIFIFCDVDICFKRDFISNLTHLLKKYDVVAQSSESLSNERQYCSGFYAGVKNTKTINFLKAIIKDLKQDVNNNNNGDQHYFNIHSGMLKIKKLNSKFLCLGKITKRVILTTENDIKKTLKRIKGDEYLVHANFIVTTHKKYLFLIKYFKEIFLTHKDK